MCVYLCVPVYVYLHVSFVCMCMNVFVSVYVYAYTSAYVWGLSVCVCLCVYLYICICVTVSTRGNTGDSPSRVKRGSKQEVYNRELAHVWKLTARSAASQMESKKSLGHRYSLRPNPETQKNWCSTESKLSDVKAGSHPSSSITLLIQTPTMRSACTLVGSKTPSPTRPDQGS